MKNKILYLIIVVLLALLAYKYSNNKTTNIVTTSKGDLCTRTTPYNNPPEFTRAISLIVQRNDESKIASAIEASSQIKSVLNCIDIKYQDLTKEGAEGYFLFDTNSTTEDLKIYVSNSYKNYDDILTAVLLAHELTHVKQRLDFTAKGSSLPCIDSEIQAYNWEFAFITYLNDEEIKSLRNRISINPNLNPAYQGTWKLIDIYYNTANCSNTNTCVGGNTSQRLRNIVIDNPFYQKECSL